MTKETEVEQKGYLSMRWKHLLLGDIQFGASDEYLAFKYAFALILMWAGIPLLALFITGDMFGANQIGHHGITVRIYFVLSCALIALLRGRLQLFYPVIWTYALASYLVHVSGFMLVPDDEQRLVWFYSLIAGIYILLGRRAGIGFTLASIAAVLVGNTLHMQAAPISAKGMGTFLTSLISLSVIFYAFTQRTMSFYVRMQQSNEQLRHLSDHDPLTGVLNGRALTQACDRLVHLAARTGQHFAVLFIDLDHFKRVNDQHGHDAGDCVLRTIASTLTGRLRQSDVLGRVGGEEFVVFLPDTDTAGAIRLAEHLRQDIESSQPRLDAHTTLTITASIGVASGKSGIDTLESLQRQADLAMYQAKAGGRNRVSLLTADAPINGTPS